MREIASRGQNFPGIVAEDMIRIFGEIEKLILQAVKR